MKICINESKTMVLALYHDNNFSIDVRGAVVSTLELVILEMLNWRRNSDHEIENE